LGHVPVEQVHELYQLADIFSAPSRWPEPFGLVFAEAQASGLPVVATNRGGIPEIVSAGRTGLLIDDQESVSQLKESLMRLIDSKKLRLEMGQEGAKLVRERFGWAKTAARYSEIYRDLLRER
jgi:glycosyltransferase involved in cell wall biosynthesis